MTKEILFLFLFFGYSQIFGQAKIPLDEEAFFSWQSIENRQISVDGLWLTYELVPNKGDGVLYVLNTVDKTTMRINRGQKAHFDESSQKLICTIKPGEIMLDSLKKKKVKDEELPTDTLLIIDLKNGYKEYIPDIKSIKVPSKWHGWIYYELVKDRDTTLQKSLPRKLDKDESIYVCHQLDNNKKDTLLYVRSLILAEETPISLSNQNAPDSSKTTLINRYQLNNSLKEEIFSIQGKITNLSSTKNGSTFSWLLDSDTTAHVIPKYDLYLWHEVGKELQKINANADIIPENWMISSDFQIVFSPENQRLFFGIAPIPQLPDTTLLPDEIPELEIWNYQDQVLYTQQKVQEKEEKKRTYLVSYDLLENQVVSLGNPDLPTVETHSRKEIEWAIGLDDQSMRKYLSWEGRVYKDLYLVSLLDGEKELIRKKISGNPKWSPGGRFIYWYEEPDTTWYAYSLEKERLIDLTLRNKNFSDELNDLPDYPNSYGLAGWKENDERIYIYDRYDIWEIDPSGNSGPRQLTQGRESTVQHRYVQLDKEEDFLKSENWTIRGFNEKTKEEFYARISPDKKDYEILLSGNFHLDHSPLKAENTDIILFTKETFNDFPDIYLAKDHNFAQAQKLTDANPQQNNYNWGTIELVEWQAPDGSSLNGLLVKPEDFDPTRKYPMIVNFYERSSDGLHSHRAPFPHRSTINYTYYASNGYVIFNPDIVYKVGSPGQSAYDAVMSGTKAILDLGFVDPKRIGLQGHSWGGYQIAHIVTKTDMFACAESGAPVVNMISAYGGIRWGTGLSRMFQYEHTQSRLGATLWERPDLYIENSPIFNIDKVTTPVLILHNDQDSAVPWYQGIEFFVAMRRLNKPAWMLNYNGEPHWPLKWPNRLDFNRRLFQFFEHYLKDAPMPVWMSEGVPAVEKGINSGLELAEEK